MNRRATAMVVAIGGVATVLTACSSSGQGGAGASGSSVTVVASTDVWGDVAHQVVGSVPGVGITSIITDPAADPHSYESDARTALAVKKASLLVENGGGYDDFMQTLRSSTGTRATVLNAVTISGHTAPAGEDLNEHVWYDFPTVVKVADDIADALSDAAPAHASRFRANAKAFDAKVVALEGTEAALKRTAAGRGVAITEPVPLYMLQAIGLVDRTPSRFSEAIEEGNDVPISVLDETEALFRDRSVALLAYNEQTTGAETEKVLAAAKENGVPVVPVTETLPAGRTYLTWMTANLAHIRTALGS